MRSVRSREHRWAEIHFPDLEALTPDLSLETEEEEAGRIGRWSCGCGGQFWEGKAWVGAPEGNRV